MNGIFTSLVATAPRGTRSTSSSARTATARRRFYLGDVAHPAEPPRALTKGPDRSISGRPSPRTGSTSSTTATPGWPTRTGTSGASRSTWARPISTPWARRSIATSRSFRAASPGRWSTRSTWRARPRRSSSCGRSRAASRRPCTRIPPRLRRRRDARTRRRALVVRWNSATDLVLFEVDTGGKEPRASTRRRGRARTSATRSTPRAAARSTSLQPTRARRACAPRPRREDRGGEASLRGRTTPRRRASALSRSRRAETASPSPS